MSVQPIRRTTAASTVAEELRDALLSGLFAPGTPLAARDVAERVGADPTVVRAALAELARDGLVVHSLHRGVEVAADHARGPARHLRGAAGVRVAGLEALLRRRPADVELALRGAPSAWARRRSRATAAALVEADMAFHLAIVAAAGSRRLDALRAERADGAAAPALGGRPRGR